MGSPSSSGEVQNMLQRAVQTVQWTYSLFWQVCPQQGMLVWCDGYYNGAIKTRKTVQPMEVSAEEASLERSRQLRELYHSLSTNAHHHQIRRPSAALSPEDLTESEWFYLMCVSFSFPPGVGLPGRAYSKRQHVWLNSANEVDSKVFSRAILAKSAGIQTVVCIPLLDGVLELGTTERVEEDLGLVQHMRSLFIGHEHPQPPKQALSEHSTSNPAPTSSSGAPVSATLICAAQANTNQIEEGEAESDSDAADTESGVQNPANTLRPPLSQTEPSELMQLDMSEVDVGGAVQGPPDDGISNNNLGFDRDPDQPVADVRDGNSLDNYNYIQQQSDQLAADLESTHDHYTWPPHLEDPLMINMITTQFQPPASSSGGIHGWDELSEEESHYSQTVSNILLYQTSRCSETSTLSSSAHNSAFSDWSSTQSQLAFISSGHSQRLLKYIVFQVPFTHSKLSGPGELIISGANHVLAERRRREKLNERFIVLRSLVPFVTKMDKASILGDTIEYVKQLREKIQELEAHIRKTELEAHIRKTELEAHRDQERFKESAAAVGLGLGGEPKKNINVQKKGARPGPVQGRVLSNRRKMRILVDQKVGGGSGKPKADPASEVEVSIIESDALVELQCGHREGLLLDVMQMLRELRVEITSAQSSLTTTGTFVAELRARVKENVNGRKATITDVKRAIRQIIPY